MSNFVDWVDHEIHRREISYDFGQFLPLQYYKLKYLFISEKTIVTDLLENIVTKRLSELTETLIDRLQAFLFRMISSGNQDGMFIPMCGNELKNYLLSYDPAKIVFIISEMNYFLSNIKKPLLNINFDVPEQLSESFIEICSDRQILILENNSAPKAKKYEKFMNQVCKFIEYFLDHIVN